MVTLERLRAVQIVVGKDGEIQVQRKLTKVDTETLFLKRTVGNQAVQRLIKSTGLLAKLRIGEPGDIYEKEADSVAKQVMTDAQKHGEVVSGRTQGLETYIDSLNGGGMPMPDSLRNFFEPRFCHDFSKVKVHTDAKAAESARSVNARAYTIGKHMVLGEGQYAPETETGKNLLAHELTHVVQQSGLDRNRIGQNNEKCDLSPISQIVGTTTQKIARQADIGSYPGGQGSVSDEEEASETIKQIEPLTSEIGHGERYKVRSALMDMRSRSRI